MLSKKDQKKPRRLLNNLYTPKQAPQNSSQQLQNTSLSHYIPQNNYPVQRVKIFFFFFLNRLKKFVNLLIC